LATAVTAALAVIGCAPATAQDGMRVMNGSFAAPGAYPSMVSLQRADRRSHFCGGTVIGSEWVLTAAHCVTDNAIGGRNAVNPPTSLVVAEPRDQRTENTPDAVRILRVAEIHVHPAYQVFGQQTPQGLAVYVLSHDLALLRLAEPSRLPRQLLVAGSARREAESANRAATVTGFGHTGRFVQEGGATQQVVSSRLMEGSLPIAPIERCAQRFRDRLPPGLYGRAEICAGGIGGGVDACQGDSGGPLFIRAASGNVQVGLVSSGPPCDASRRRAGFGTYASVASMETFIRTHVTDASFVAQVAPTGAGAAFNTSGAGQGTPPDANVSPQGMGAVTIDIREGNRLRVGSTATFRITSNITGLLGVIAQNPAGELVQLFPNNRVAGIMSGQAVPIIRAGQTVLVPGPADGFRAVVRPPLGGGTVFAIVIPETAQGRALIGRHTDLAPVRDPASFLNAIGGLIATARNSTPDGLPTNTAIGERAYEVVDR
jgi:secreted trypsin-like serine protease